MHTVCRQAYGAWYEVAPSAKSSSVHMKQYLRTYLHALKVLKACSQMMKEHRACSCKKHLSVCWLAIVILRQVFDNAPVKYESPKYDLPRHVHTLLHRHGQACTINRYIS